MHVRDTPGWPRAFLTHESWRGKHITISADASLFYHSCDYLNQKVLACCEIQYDRELKAWHPLPTLSQGMNHE